MTNHAFVNSDPTKFDSNCATCGGKHRDSVHGMTAVERELPVFVDLCQQVVNRSYNQPGFSQKLSTEKGQRYARIVITSENHVGGSVYCFVDLENGDVLKSASWKSPAKGARGNILAPDNGMSRMTPYGAGYNR